MPIDKLSKLADTLWRDVTTPLGETPRTFGQSLSSLAGDLATRVSAGGSHLRGAVPSIAQSRQALVDRAAALVRQWLPDMRATGVHVWELFVPQGRAMPIPQLARRVDGFVTDADAVVHGLTPGSFDFAKALAALVRLKDAAPVISNSLLATKRDDPQYDGALMQAAIDRWQRSTDAVCEKIFALPATHEVVTVMQARASELQRLADLIGGGTNVHLAHDKLGSAGLDRMTREGFTDDARAMTALPPADPAGTV